MGLWGNDPSIFDTKSFKMLELYIETLQGTAFELRVSPLDTIADVKNRIYRLEGIPISQQHLLFNSTELDDDYSLQDYDIQDGNTLKLVPQMRVGPINTRRIHIEEPSLRDYADYFTEANPEEFYEKVPSNARPLTVIVYQNGDQINLYRIVDRDSASPLSESLSNSSMYGANEEEDEDSCDGNKTKQEDEHEKLREKMKSLKIKLGAHEKQKPKYKKLPRPPSCGRKSAGSRVRRVPSAKSASNRSKIFNKNMCLPPVGTTSTNHAAASTPTLPSNGLVLASSATPPQSSAAETAAGGLMSATPPSLLGVESEQIDFSTEEFDQVPPLLSGSHTAIDLAAAAALSIPPPQAESSSPVSSVPTSATIRKKMETDSAKLFRLSSVKEDEPSIETDEVFSSTTTSTNPSKFNPSAASNSIPPSTSISSNLFGSVLRNNSTLLSGAKSPLKFGEISQDVLLGDGGTLKTETSNNNSLSTTNTNSAQQQTLPMSSPVKDLASSASYTYKEPSSSIGRKSRSSKGLERLISENVAGPNEPSLLQSGTSRPTTSTTLEALKETLGRPTTTSSKRSTIGSKVILETLNEREVRAMSGMLSNYVRSSSRASRNGFTKDGCITTSPPESRLVSGRLRMSAGRDGHVTPHRHLPPVKAKKKAVKRCAICNKKTGLATSYPCRCGLNLCATHRYAESHQCTFDYKTEGRKLLEQNNPVVTAPKLPKI